MKKLWSVSVLLAVLFGSTVLLTGCVASAQPGVVVARGPGYYPPPRPYYGYRARPYYHRPARVVVVERAPVIVRPRPVIVRPRPGYYHHDARQPVHGGYYGRSRGRIR